MFTAICRKMAYRHTGRFDQSALPKLDSRCEVVKGDQFNYSRNKDGSISKGSKEALNVNAFIEMLDNVEASLRKMGCGIYKGVAGLDPYRKGTTTACDQCDYASICRIDRWTHRYRVLGEIEEES
jgi:ATP-dependent helicase/nuclease subunit B